jgi:glycosyltransferase involved in cell wall biosynthesis
MLHISAVIPTYNRRALVVRAIESVLAQTYPVREIIVVDDGSTDGTEERLRPYVAKSARSNRPIRYIRQEKTNAGVARNRGIAEAAGNWIGFLDSDDEWLPDKLEWQVRALQKFAARSVACTTDANYVNNPLMTKTAFQMDRVRCRGEIGIFPHLKKQMVSGYHGVYLPTLVVKRKAIQAIGGFDPSLTITEDTDFLYRLVGKTTVCYVNKPLVAIDRTPGRPTGLMEVFKDENLTYQLDQYRFEKWLREDRGSDVEIRKLLRRAIHNTHIGLANCHLVKGDYKMARQSLSLAMEYGFSRRAAFNWLATTVGPGLARKVLVERRGRSERETSPRIP